MRSGYLSNVLIGTVAFVGAGSRLIPGSDQPGPVLKSAVAFMTGKSAPSGAAAGEVATLVANAVDAMGPVVGPLSHPAALGDAFRAYYAYKTRHPAAVTKPYLYFVDYGLSSTTPRGYVFDMQALTIVDGPFMVAHGRGSSSTRFGVPSRFSNESGSEATSLGLYLTQSTYGFHGRTGGQSYASVGLQLLGVSHGFNDNASARGVVAHGAPYVTSRAAGRSEGCPAMEQSRASDLLPKLANGAMVFLFAPDQQWMATDPWLTADLS